MPTQLTLYNGALRKLGERRLASLAENRESRRALDDAWQSGAFIDECLQAGLWNFATKSVQADYSPDIEPDFGYRRAFDKPEDFILSVAICSDPYFRSPLLDYNDEAGFWFSDFDIMYIKYVSNDEDYGNDMSLWPPNFTEFVEYALAEKVCKRLTQSETGLQDIKRDLKKSLTSARSTDAMADPTQFPPSGSWTGARHRGSRKYRNNTWG
jgi:hypothetical protein